MVVENVCNEREIRMSFLKQKLALTKFSVALYAWKLDSSAKCVL